MIKSKSRQIAGIKQIFIILFLLFPAFAIAQENVVPGDYLKFRKEVFKNM